MKTYVGTKEISAIAMNRLDYNKYRGWELPADENGEDEGYLVEYAGDNSNHPEHKGYISWSPKKQFEESYIELNLTDIHGSSEWPHEQRVIEEANELSEKAKKLSLFMETNPVFTVLPQEERCRLKLQLVTMKAYYSILFDRIQNFKL